MALDNYDALALIHPDFGIIYPDRESPINPDYKNNVLETVNLFLENGKPVFYVEGRQKIMDRDMLLVLANAFRIPADDPGYINFQQEIDFISERTRMEPGQMRLAGGGTHARKCVWAYMTSWCGEVEPKYPGNVTWQQKPPERLIGYGRILPNIV